MSDIYLLKLKKEINKELYILLNNKSNKMNLQTKYTQIFQSEDLESNEDYSLEELIERKCKKLRKYNERIPLKKLSSYDRSLDFEKICKILKEDYNKRKWIKNFIEFDYLTNAYTRRSELIINEDIFKMNEEVNISRWGYKTNENKKRIIIFDQIFNENNYLIYEKTGKIIKILPEQIIIKLDDEEISIKIKRIKRKEFVIKKLENQND